MKNITEITPKSTNPTEIQTSERKSVENNEKKEEATVQENIVIDNDTLLKNFINALRIQIKELEPKLDISSDIALFEAVLRKIDNDHSTCITLSEQNRAIANAIESNPRLLIFLKELMGGTPARVALIKSDLTNLEPDINDDQYEEYNLAVAQTRERRDKIKKQAEMRLSKCQKCGEIAQEFYHEMELNDDQIDEFVEFLERAIDTIFEANIDRDFIETMWKAYSYEKEIQKAKKQGQIEGKNEVIAIHRTSQSDGLSSFSSSGTKSEAPIKQGYIERLLNQRYS